jgi:formate dehydrogenase subunit gamma
MAVAADRARDLASPPPADRVERHAGIDRLFHWLTALAVLTLMATGLLPQVGVRFDWVRTHWVTGIALVVLVVFHILRSVLRQRLATMFSPPEARVAPAGRTAPGAGGVADKYTIAQKLMHLAMTLMVLAAVVTGLVMLKKIRTPLLVRDPYFLGADTWGVVYFIHGLAAIAAVTLVMIHVYFALIPENRSYLLAMVRGWMTREEDRTRGSGLGPPRNRSS